MPSPDERAQLGPLVRTFVARFFENDLTASAHDLKRSFFGLLAILGIPGALAPFVIGFTWQIVGRYQGLDALRVIARADKTLYLGCTMIAAAAVCALTWDSLLVDRRDALVLGTQPVRPRTIILAKLVALAVYVGGIGLTMHALSAASWGLFLDQGRDGSLLFIIRGTIAHFVAGCAATAFTVFVVMGLQGVVVSVGGPRLFERFSAVFQIALVVVIGLGLVIVPVASQSIVAAMNHPDDPATQWVLSTPPAWFLGIYELILGNLSRPELSGDLVVRLARTAILATASAFIVALVSSVLASRRVIRVAVAQGSHSRWTWHLPRTVLVRWSARSSGLRAVATFVLMSLTRVERQRLALGAGIGVAIAYALPVLKDWRHLIQSPAPPAALLALPTAVMVIWLAALRVALSLPADLKAAWIFDVERPAADGIRGVVERLLLFIGVAPAVAGGTALIALQWGIAAAAVHAAFATVFGLLLTELLIGASGAIPGTQPWRPERAHLRSRWPFIAVGFVWLSRGWPVNIHPPIYLETAMIANSAVAAVVIGALIVAAFEVRRRCLRRLRDEPPIDDDLPEGISVTVRLN